MKEEKKGYLVTKYEVYRQSVIVTATSEQDAIDIAKEGNYEIIDDNQYVEDLDVKGIKGSFVWKAEELNDK